MSAKRQKRSLRKASACRLASFESVLPSLLGWGRNMKAAKTASLLAVAACLSMSPWLTAAATAPPALSAASPPKSDDSNATPMTPSWTKMPTAEEMSGYYPRLPWMFGMKGMVYLDCSATAAGTLQHCFVESEQPSGLGFANAALQLASFFQLRPRVVNGTPVDGVPVRFCISFQLPPPDKQPVQQSGSAPTARSLDLARQIVLLLDASTPGQRAKLASDQLEASIGAAFSDPDWRTPQARAAIEAYSEAWAEAYPRMVERASLAFAETYSEQQLSDILAFYHSPSGKAWMARSGDLERARNASVVDVYKTIYDDARQRLCAKIACQ